MLLLSKGPGLLYLRRIVPGDLYFVPRPHFPLFNHFLNKGADYSPGGFNIPVLDPPIFGRFFVMPDPYPAAGYHGFDYLLSCFSLEAEGFLVFSIDLMEFSGVDFKSSRIIKNAAYVIFFYCKDCSGLVDPAGIAVVH